MSLERCWLKPLGFKTQAAVESHLSSLSLVPNKASICFLGPNIPTNLPVQGEPRYEPCCTGGLGWLSKQDISCDQSHLLLSGGRMAFGLAVQRAILIPMALSPVSYRLLREDILIHKMRVTLSASPRAVLRIWWDSIFRPSVEAGTPYL